MKSPNEDTFHENPVPHDGKAMSEQAMFSNDHMRKEKFKSHFSRILIVFLYVASIIVLSMVIIWAYHFLLPEKCYFLSDDRYHEIQNMLFAGLVSQAIPYISTYLKKQDSKEKNN